MSNLFSRFSLKDAVSRIRSAIRSYFLPGFDWIQVEVTSYCNAACSYCPYTVLRDHWVNRHMTMETFGYIIPALKNAKLAYLQGWGEPLLNTNFFTMVEHAKKAGCLVGTTTNGMILEKSMIESVIQSGLDILSFSLANTDSCNDHIRQGAPVETVLERIRELNTAKEKAGSDKPAIHVAYVLLRSNKDDVKMLPSRLKGLGVSEVVISTLDYIPSSELSREELFPRTAEEFEDLRAYLETVQAEGHGMAVPIHYQIGCGYRRRSFCSENIEKALVISATGDVLPCVSASIPVSAEHGQTQYTELAERLNFGNITKRSLADIWWSKRYKEFRRSFYQKNRTASCQNCLKLNLMHFAPPGGKGGVSDLCDNLGSR
jgi:radical SAM protein with 4Fe4S-binding SPASM domain